MVNSSKLDLVRSQNCEDIVITIGDTDTYTLEFTERGKAIDISSYTSATLTIAKRSTPQTALDTISLSSIGGGSDNNTATFVIDTSSLTVKDGSLTEEYLGQVKLIKAGENRYSKTTRVKVQKNLGET